MFGRVQYNNMTLIIPHIDSITGITLHPMIISTPRLPGEAGELDARRGRGYNLESLSVRFINININTVQGKNITLSFRSIEME